MQELIVLSIWFQKIDTEVDSCFRNIFINCNADKTGSIAGCLNYYFVS